VSQVAEPQRSMSGLTESDAEPPVPPSHQDHGTSPPIVAFWTVIMTGGSSATQDPEGLCIAPHNDAAQGVATRSVPSVDSSGAEGCS
jgi:hypothetical protein